MASRFWVGGTGTWDASSTTHWAASSGGASGASVPGSADTVTFDGSSGGGTVTVNTDVSVQSIACGAFTGTLDFSVNNNNVTISGANPAFNGSGTGTRSIKLGSGTWSFTSTAGAGGTRWNMSTTTNLTFDAGSSILSFAATNNSRINFQGGGLTYATIEFLTGAGNSSWLISGTNTIGTLKPHGGNAIVFNNNQTINGFDSTGLSSSSQCLLESPIDSGGSSATISKSSGSLSMSWAAILALTFSGGATFAATNSYDLGGNSGITITPPSGGNSVHYRASMSGNL